MSHHHIPLEEAPLSRFDAALWRRILEFVRPYRGPLAVLCLAGALMAVADSLLPWITGRLLDDALTRDGASLHRWILAYAGLAASVALFVWVFIRMAGRAATGIAYDVRRTAFAHLQELSFSFYDHRPVGWLMARLTSDCARLANVIPWFFLDLVWGSCFILGIAVMMLLLDVHLALLVLLVLPPLALVSRVFQVKLLRSQRLVRKTNSLLTASFNEAIMGVRTTKALVREEENLEEFRRLSRAMNQHSLRNLVQAALYLPLVLTLGSVGTGLALWHGGVRLGDELSLGTLVAFMQYTGLLWIPVSELAERFTQLQAAQASAERLVELLETEPEIRDTPRRLSRITDEERAAARIRSVEFHQVEFHYKPDEPILRDFNLTVREGETIALVGATGGGKSTIVNLLGRFYEPTQGAIRINGKDTRDWGLEWLHERLGIVLQTPHLFQGSIRDNIRYGCLEASDAQIEAVAREVRAHRFIQDLPEGYDTDVGEGGSRLSLGQRQLVALARALLSDPQIFILDEATSSVDLETEQWIQEGIEAALRGRISFVIAHRLSTIRGADRILVVRKGRIVEQGNHEELLLRGGAYAELHQEQFLGATPPDSNPRS